MKRFNVFPGIIFVLLGLNFVIVGITVVAAHSDGGAVIEPDYYQKALHWDEHRAQQEHSRTLGWSAGIDLTSRQGAWVLGATVKDRAGEAIVGAKVRAVAFRSADAGRRQTLDLRETSPGRYEAAVQAGIAGGWHVELNIEARGEVFTLETLAIAEDAP